LVSRDDALIGFSSAVDSPACFAAQLLAIRKRALAIFPEEEVVETRRRYLATRMILETESKPRRRRASDRFHAATWREPGHHPIVEGWRGIGLDADGLVIRF